MTPTGSQLEHSAAPGPVHAAHEASHLVQTPLGSAKEPEGHVALHRPVAGCSSGSGIAQLVQLLVLPTTQLRQSDAHLVGAW